MTFLTFWMENRVNLGHCFFAWSMACFMQAMKNPAAPVRLVLSAVCVLRNVRMPVVVWKIPPFCSQRKRWSFWGRIWESQVKPVRVKDESGKMVSILESCGCPGDVLFQCDSNSVFQQSWNMLKPNRSPQICFMLHQSTKTITMSWPFTGVLSPIGVLSWSVVYSKVDDFWPAAVKMISDMGFLQSLPLGWTFWLEIRSRKPNGCRWNLCEADLWQGQHPSCSAGNFSLLLGRGQTSQQKHQEKRFDPMHSRYLPTNAHGYCWRSKPLSCGISGQATIKKIAEYTVKEDFQPDRAWNHRKAEKIEQCIRHT